MDVTTLKIQYGVRRFMPYTGENTQLKNDLKQFASWLQSSRKSRGLTQDALADLSEVDQGLISKYERGALPCPRLTVYALAAALSGPEADERTTAALLNAGLRAAGFASLSEVIEVQYEAILDELHSASYSGGLEPEDVSEVAEIIRMKARRKAEKQGRA